ncbi:MAG: hypothetical protein H0X35_15120 [Pseudonocardiales bacterium]|nr:hypothetical protein [Pseudonocardiales bacterium]
MTDQITISDADLQTLTGKLGGADFLSEHEQAVLASVFVLAGQAVAGRGAEVSGFINFTSPVAAGAAGDGSVRVANGMLLPAVRTGGLLGGFHFGLHNPPMD